MKSDVPDNRNRISRRRLLTAGLAAPVATVAGAKLVQHDMPWQAGLANTPAQAVTTDSAEPRYHFFSAAESALVEAAVARLIPADDLGPGALEAGVPVYIDRQLAGPYGRAERWYMQGPWAEGLPTQGYQSRLTPAGIYRGALREIDAAVARASGDAAAGATFARLAPAEQDRWLQQLEDGQTALDAVDAKGFFALLLQNTKEGFWSDPIYGGNRDMVGWKLIGFPGARYDHRPYVAKHGEAYPLPPVGLKGRVAWLKSE